jgi:hypothetical protein
MVVFAPGPLLSAFCITAFHRELDLLASAVCVESTGAVPARDLVFMAIERLIEKCTKVTEAYEAAKAQENGGVLDAADVAKATIAAMTTEPDDLSAR